MSIAMSIPPKLPDIPPLDGEAQQRALERQRHLVKPNGSLGKLEIISTQIAGMTGRLDWLPRTPVVAICAGDHGIAERGVSAYPRNVTKQMVLNFLEGGAAINVLARQFGAEVVVVDAGVAGILPEHERLIGGKINYGTGDFSTGMAMTPGQADKAIQLGLQVAAHLIDNGADIIVTGEMGIGNTTAAAALIAALTSAEVDRVTGRGTGIDPQQLDRKISLIRRSLDLHAPVHVDTLAKFGGYEIATLVGLMVGSAARRVPVVLDGVITASAALVAAKLAPRSLNYFIAGHRGVEPGHTHALQALGLTPVLELSLRLGEGTGGALSLPIIEAAMRTLQEMATFGESGVSGPSD